MDKAIVIIEVEFNDILSKLDIYCEIKEWLKELNFEHLINKKLMSVK